MSRTAAHLLQKASVPKLRLMTFRRAFARGSRQRDMAHIKVLHVVAALQILMHIALACTATQAKLKELASRKAAQTRACLCTA